MLIGIEGPDRAGKTTLLEPVARALGATLLTRLPTDRGAFAAWDRVEPVYLHLLGQLYDPSRLYVTDRSMTVSGLVYSRVFERPCRFDPAPWVPCELVVYVETPLEVMRARWAREVEADPAGGGVFPERMYGRVIEEYGRVLAEHGYATVVVSGTAPVGESVERVVQAVRARCAALHGLPPPHPEGRAPRT